MHERPMQQQNKLECSIIKKVSEFHRMELESALHNVVTNVTGKFPPKGLVTRKQSPLDDVIMRI